MPGQAIQTRGIERGAARFVIGPNTDRSHQPAVKLQGLLGRWPWISSRNTAHGQASRNCCRRGCSVQRWKDPGEHIYWDQASVLAQIGLVDVEKPPVTRIEASRKVLDSAQEPSNGLIRRLGG